MGFIGLDLGKDRLCGKAEKVACTGSDKCHDKGWLKAIKKKKRTKRPLGKHSVLITRQMPFIETTYQKPLREG